MTRKKTLVPEWHKKRTPETKRVEKLLRQHFAESDAYRYNSASIRLRVVDPQFKGLSREKRDDLVEPILDQLDAATQGDILNLVMLYPGEENDSPRAMMANLEFEHPAHSMLS